MPEGKYFVLKKGLVKEWNFDSLKQAQNYVNEQKALGKYKRLKIHERPEHWSATKDGYEGRKGICVKCGRKFDIINRGDVICDDCEFENWQAEEDRKKMMRRKRYKLKKVM